MKKVIVGLFIVLITAFLLVGCTSPGPVDEDIGDLPTFTLEELAQFDGKDGNQAYVAVDGVVYDVTDVPQWRNGSHQGLTAGGDWTSEINQMSPHGTRVLDRLPVVGRLE
jgi:predicted heme/steroid binding protein